MKLNKFSFLTLTLISILVITIGCSEQTKQSTETSQLNPSDEDKIKDTNPLGLQVKSITFHEGFRAPGLKAVDVEVVSRVNDFSERLQKGDEIVEIVGTTGKFYNMVGSKGTGITPDDSNNNSLIVQRMVQYNDIDMQEENITKVIFQYHTGKRVELMVHGITPTVTHP